MTATYNCIATSTLGSAGTFSFTSIPSTYTDLVLVIRGGSVTADNGARFQFNGDTSSNYSFTEIGGNGSTAGSRAVTNQGFGTYGYDFAMNSAIEYVGICQINNYYNTTSYKTYLARGGRASSLNSPGLSLNIGLWRNTSAINRIDVVAASGNFIAGTTLSLYGIKAE